MAEVSPSPACRSTVDFAGGLPAPPAGDGGDDVDDEVVRGGELRLAEERKQALVAAVAVDDEDLAAAVAGHLVQRFLEEGSAACWRL